MANHSDLSGANSEELDNFAYGNSWLSRALAVAGGIAQDADIRQVTVRRLSDNNRTQSSYSL